MLAVWFYLQPQGRRKMDEEYGGMGYRSTVSRGEDRGGGGWRSQSGRQGKKGRWRENRKRGRAGGDECAAIYSSLSTVWVWMHVCRRCASGSSVRKTDRMASVTCHVERGEGDTHCWTQHAVHRHCWEKTSKTCFNWTEKWHCALKYFLTALDNL